MLNSLGRWLATNRVVAFLVVVGSIAAALWICLALNLKWSEARTLISFSGDVRWREFFLYLGAIATVIATLEGLLSCIQKRTLTIEAWWPRTRSGLFAASIAVWLSWLNIALDARGTRWGVEIKRLTSAGHAIFFILAIVFVVWIAVFHIIVPMVHAFAKEGGEQG
jgi:hypothetical protein